MSARWVLVVLFSLVSPLSDAASQISSPKIVPHLVSHDAGAGLACDTDPVEAGIGCSDLITYGSTCTAYDVYMVVGQADSNGVAGLTIGIDYDGEHQVGVDVLGWQLCATGLEFPFEGWPDAGSGISLTWNTATCGLMEIPPDGVHATAGVFYVYAYSPDTFVFTANQQWPVAPKLIIANCIGQEWALDPVSDVLGYADFGGGPGCNPCKGPCVVLWSKNLLPRAPCPGVPVEPITWGRIKGLYR